MKFKLVKRDTAPDDKFALETWGDQYWVADLSWGEFGVDRAGYIGFGSTRREAIWGLLKTVWLVLTNRSDW